MDYSPIFTTHHGEITQFFLGVMELDLLAPTCNLDKTSHQDLSRKFRNHQKLSLRMAYMVKNDVLIQSQATILKNLENQMGQLATELQNRP
ncbi:hypothetical protein EPI10_024619 [Gossypium australe]|uniref:Uncharacterized protein n=1 Tax=Gossypium australe TaxID=47621 RepID=A0A5B6VZ15_9ROSI|nr:hypothetical protein EPI10_024619 [Gossypium australe]